MRILCEGIDKTWKSTLVKYLSEQLKLPIVKFSQPKTNDPFNEYVEFFGKHTSKEIINDNIICDRSRIGENIYGPVYRKKWLKKFQIKRLDIACMRHWDLIIRCNTDKWTIKKKFIEDKEDFAQAKDIWRLQRYYLKTLKQLQTTIIQYDRTLWNMDSIVQIIKALSVKPE